MKILFVAKELKMDPLGIMYLSAALKERGHKVDLARCDDGMASPEELVEHINPDVLAYSVCSGLEDFYLELDERLRRQARPTVISAFGGPAFTFNAELRMTTDERVGMAAFGGECERTLADYLEDCSFSPFDYARAPFRITPPMQLVDVNLVPFADRSIAYQYKDLQDNPIKNVITRRGCKYACSYCFNRDWNKMFRDQLPKGIIRYRRPSLVIAECTDIKREWPVEMFNFVDDNFASDIQWLRDFCGSYKETIGLPFFCSVRPEDASEEAIELIAQGGGWIVNMAIESANDENRHKVLTRAGKKETVVEAIKRVHDHGMVTRLQNIIGLPVEDPLADAYETLDFNILAKPTSSWCALLQCYKGTHVHKLAAEGGYLHPDERTDEEFFGYSFLKIKDKRKIERLHKLWPLITKYPIFRVLAPLLIRLPLPFSWYRWFFAKTKKWLAERDLWTVCRGR